MMPTPVSKPRKTPIRAKSAEISTGAIGSGPTRRAETLERSKNRRDGIA